MRLFVAINFNNEMKSAINNCMVQMGRQHIRADYTQINNLHLTMAFIGEYDDAYKVQELVSSISFSPFEIQLSGYGSFGNLLWIGLSQCPELNSLEIRLKKILTENNIPFDKKPFSPHITLARRVEHINSVTLNVPQTKMLVSSINLMESTRHNGRLVYKKIKKAK